MGLPDVGMHIAFLTTRLNRPSFRFRVQQFYPTLQRRGHRCDTVVLPRRSVRRLMVYRSLKDYDLVFVQKRLFNAVELRILRLCARRLVYDLDDAMMYETDGRRCRHRARRLAAVVRSADLLICGNRYLAEQASRGSAEIVVLPTAVDTERFSPAFPAQRPSNHVTVGWTGSRGTNPCLNELFPVLARLPDSARVKVMSNSLDHLDLARLGHVPLEYVAWSAETEVAQTQSFDVGVMPLPDNPWTRGKCGCKALQYMALGIPAVCSPVGVNREIVGHGQTGFLPRTPQEWQDVLTTLVHDAAQRRQIGLAGRIRVEQAYSVHVVGQQLARTLERVCGKHFATSEAPDTGHTPSQTAPRPAA